MKRIISCQVWEWYGSEDFTEGRYKAKGGAEFVFDETPETEAMTEEELMEKWNEQRNRSGLWFRYEARSVDYYWKPDDVCFKNGEFLPL